MRDSSRSSDWSDTRRRLAGYFRPGAAGSRVDFVIGLRCLSEKEDETNARTFNSLSRPVSERVSVILLLRLIR